MTIPPHGSDARGRAQAGLRIRKFPRQQQAIIEHTLSGGDSLAEFADIPGVREKKLERYGKDFLEVIARDGTT